MYIYICVCVRACVYVYMCARACACINSEFEFLKISSRDSFPTVSDRGKMIVVRAKKKKICIDVYISRRFDRYAGKEHVHRRNENVSKTEEGCLCSSCYTSERKKKTRRRNFLFFFVLFLLFFFFFFYYYYYCLNLYFYATLVERENGFRSFRFVSWPRESRFARNENYLQLPLRSSSPAFFDDKTRTKRYVHVLMSTI